MENCNNISKASFDPGWNDPPKLSYTAQQTTPGKPRNILNKRVAFPMSGNNSSALPGPTPMNLPPIPTVPPLPIQDIKKPTEDKNIENIDSAIVLEETKAILLEFLENSSELGPKANDIKRRISVMGDMWSSGKLNNQVQTKMKELAIALKEDQPTKADDIHRALMVDHVSAVGIWMPGVKQLIHHCIARAELFAIDRDTSSVE